MRNEWRILAVLTSLYATTLWAAQDAAPPAKSLVEKARQAAGAGRLAYRLTTPEELKAVLGPPVTEDRKRDGGMEVLTLRYPGLTAQFGGMWEFPSSFTLLAIGSPEDESQIDIGQERQVVLRSADDLTKFDAFWGLADVSLVRLDLREHQATLEKMPFDSQTQWPGRDKLPEGFDPALRLEGGKNPGLGVARLHAQGIDGHGVGIAIIDQPLVKDHQEYAGRMVRYEPVDVDQVPPQMHGPAVASLAVGRKCGVAPKAALYFYAVPIWKWGDNRPWAEQLEKIIAFNGTLKDQPKIRVVSISLGAFSQRRNYDLWKAAVDKASQNGILVVTCDPAFLRLATLRRDPSRDPNDPACYTVGQYSSSRAALCVPAGNRTTASQAGPDVYTYWIEGGQSWTVPYLAGLAALAFQVDPQIPPAQIAELWTATATKTPVGPIVNPPQFIEAVQSRANKANP
jgi:serine protease AprX